jgi:dTDP-4-amino-4,6-dideoxygalactose transaminase
VAVDSLPGTPALLGGAPAFKDPVYVTRAVVPDEAAFAEHLASIFASRWFTNDGQIALELEERLRERLGVRFCAAFCNGTIALHVALRTLDLFGEVITSPFTFPATVHAIQWNGLTPVFCDIDADSYNLDVSRAAELITSRTSAIVPIHVFGNPCDVLGIQRLAEQHHLKVVYDAAHAFGVSHLGRPIGSWGDLSVFSFHATKLFHTAEGGAIVGADSSHFDRCTSLRNHGIVSEEEVRGVGLNGKLSELHAAVGLASLDRTEAEIRARSRLTNRYQERLSKIEGIRFQSFTPETVRNYAYYPIEIDTDAFGLTRDQLHMALRAENIIARKYFSPLCSENPSYRHLASADPAELPNARRLAARILCLPLYGSLELDDVDRITDTIIAIQAAAPTIRRAARKH